MVKRTDIATAADEIEKALRDYAGVGEDIVARVFESSPGFLRGLVAGSKFKNMSITGRQDEAWAFLRKSVGPEYMQYLFGIHIYDPDEFRELYPGRQEGAISMFIEGVREAQD